MAQGRLAVEDSKRGGDRIPLYSRIELTTEDGRNVVEGATCTNIGLGGLCVHAASAPDPGTPVVIEVRLVGDRSFRCRGHVCWSRVTLHPELFGTPKGAPDDARFGICFDGASTQDLLPIARLMVAREDARRRARRIRRLHGLPAHA
ncbi:MAG: PilZ domain-containing protein [Myxococcota bacterium]